MNKPPPPPEPEPKPASTKEYLGDSVYVERDFDPMSIVLTTENGYPLDPSNRIILDSEVIGGLLRYCERHGIPIKD